MSSSRSQMERELVLVTRKIRTYVPVPALAASCSHLQNKSMYQIFKISGKTKANSYIKKNTQSHTYYNTELMAVANEM